MTPFEQELLKQIDVDIPWELVTKFSKMKRCLPEEVNKAADVIVEHLSDLGLPFKVYEPDIYLSIPLSASLTADEDTFKAKPPSMSISVPEGVQGELVYLEANKKNLRKYTQNSNEIFVDGKINFKEKLFNKILLTEGFGNPALTSLVQEYGARGLVVINPGKDIHWGTCTTIWGTPGINDLEKKPKIPVIAVNKQSGEELIKIARKEAYVTLKTELLEGWFKQKIPVVQIDGKEEKEHFILLHGHYDSWDVGVGDNATGDALMLEVARVLKKNQSSLRRSVRIAWWPGHSTGRYAGSTWYADNNAIDINQNCVASVNCDSPGCRWATSYHKTTSMAEMKTHVKGVIKEITDQTPDWIRPKRAGDHSFYNIGLTTYFSLSSTMPDDLRKEKNYYEVSGCGGNIAWHTENDTFEIADYNILKTDIEIYLLALWRHASTEILPTDWRETLKEFANIIDDYVAYNNFFDLSEAVKITKDLSLEMEKFYTAIRDGEILATEANDIIVKIGRHLIPINFTRNLRFDQDPAYVCPELPLLGPPSEIGFLTKKQQGFASTQLKRGQNRYVCTLSEVKDIIQRALR